MILFYFPNQVPGSGNQSDTPIPEGAVKVYRSEERLTARTIVYIRMKDSDTRCQRGGTGICRSNRPVDLVARRSTITGISCGGFIPNVADSQRRGRNIG